MCYSAKVSADYRKYTRLYGADVDYSRFAVLLRQRLEDDRIKIPKALEITLRAQTGAQASEIHDCIDQYRLRQSAKVEQELFKQRKRLADAQRTLLTKTTKAALESQRIATHKVQWCKDKLAELQRTEPKESDSRIYPGYYAPVMVEQDGRRVVQPMRYQCRPAGKPAFYDTKYPGTYNARRDNLEGFWKGQFGRTHGLLLVQAFYEHVLIPPPDGTPGPGTQTILEFRPQPEQDMLVACLWSHWSGKDEADLDSFAAITDEPPAEVAAAGHDRCIIPIKPQNIDAWLHPDPHALGDVYAMLDDRERPYYAHQMAA